MGKVIWAPSALEDVDSIAEYISRDSAYQAALFVVRLFEATINGKRIKFPERTLHTVRYDLESTYENIYEDI